MKIVLYALPIVGTIALTLFGVLSSSKKKAANCFFFFACVCYIGAIYVYWQTSLPQSNFQFEIPSTEQKDQESNDKDEPLLVRTFWLLKEQGSSITLGPCPGERCIKFILGEIEQKDNVLVQKIYVEASFLEFKRLPKYPDIIFFLDIGFHSKGCALVYPFDGSRIWFSLALLKGRTCEVFSKVWNICIEVLDTRTDSLRIKLEVRPGKKPSRPFELDRGDSNQNAPQKMPQSMKKKISKLTEDQIKSSLTKIDRLREKNNIQVALIEIKNFLKNITKAQYPELYGHLKSNEGYCYLTLGIGKKNPNNIKKAINIFQDLMLDDAKNPVKHAMLNANLGTAYAGLSKFEDEKLNLIKSISAYENSLAVFEKNDIFEHREQLMSNLADKKNRLKKLD